MQPAGRGRGKRLLYWFRTPPAVRVGRAPIDETAIRLLEQHNPDVQFDWTRILKTPQAPEPQVRRDARDGRDRDQRGRREARPAQRERSSGPSSPAAARHAAPAQPLTPPAEGGFTEAQIRAAEIAHQSSTAAVDAPRGHHGSLEDDPALRIGGPLTDRRELVESTSAVEARTAAPIEPLDSPAASDATGDQHTHDPGAERSDPRGPQRQPGDPDRPSPDQREPRPHPGEPRDPRPDQPGRESERQEPRPGDAAGVDSRAVFEVVPEDVGSASYMRLGAEGLVRLRARYAEVLARITEHPAEEDVRVELKSRAERLNPDAWVTADEVTAALERYETVFEEVRGVVGRHPQRRRRTRP
ncbi:MAG: hypothetical protein ABIQ52_11035 [Vicinamibacterales bacterium]